MEQPGEGWQGAGGAWSWDTQDMECRGLEERVNCSITASEDLGSINAVLGSAEKQAEMWLVRNLRSWSHALTLSGPGLAGAAAGAGPLRHRMVSDGHKERRGRQKKERTRRG